MNDEPPNKPSNAGPFRGMAALIDANETAGFGGAFVIIPPEGGTALQTLILDSTQDHIQFWTLLKVKCDVEIKRLDDLTRQGQFRR
jgi:hypothetical protein